MRYSLGRFTFRDVPQIAAYHNKFIFQEKVANTTLGKKNADGLYNTNLLLEVVRCGASQKRPPKDSTLRYSLGRVTFRDVPQIAAYHNKLKVFDIFILDC